MSSSNLFVGLICDGNRRDEIHKLEHEQRKVVPSVHDLSHDELLDCYARGAEVVKDITTRAREEALAVLALWGLSDKNMEGRSEQKAALFSTFETYLRELRDEWMDLEENKNVRLIHLGRKDRLESEAPNVSALLEQVEEHTRNRTGMIIALSLDHGHKEENRRAHAAWRMAGRPGDPDEGWRDFLDLYRNGGPRIPANLIIRTGAEEGRKSRYDNEYLVDYRHETRVITHELLLPCYSAELFSEDLRDYRQSTKKHGK